ncbi:MAG: hypothetical protein DYH07_13320, partial [Armatimonadetes bacterium ATM1]|nr:hypothetical protein [Armatimonadetes bacterium ATM1]
MQHKPKQRPTFDSSISPFDDYILSRLDFHTGRLKRRLRLNREEAAEAYALLASELVKASLRYRTDGASWHTFASGSLHRAEREVIR